MNAVEAKQKAKGLQYSHPTRKGWEASKAFAKECGIDIKVFNKGLGPQFDRLVGVLRGVKEIDAYVPVDERSIKSLRVEQQKLDKIITAYRAVTGPKQKPVAHTPEWYAWYVLDVGLRQLQSWAKEGIQQIDKELAARASKQRSR